MESKRLRVFLMGGDHKGWALDSELALTRRMLHFVSFSNLLFCDVIHSVYWPPLLRIPKFLVTGKKVISHLTHDPSIAFDLPGFDQVSQRVSTWAVRSQQALQSMQDRGLSARLIPYGIDTTVFFPISKSDIRIKEMIKSWKIPPNRYLVGSFQRDTEGNDLQSPKLVKGPDRFLEIVSRINQATPGLHVILAGPRRFWLRQQLLEAGIPFTYIGQEVAGDDVRQNTLSHSTMNVLYNLIDLYIVSSRKEGGPQAVLEAAATQCKIISTRVGHSEDVLDSGCLYDDVSQAVTLVENDINSDNLMHTIQSNWRAVDQHRLENLAPKWQALYAAL
jgi:glycosyltransferase involved in cell wall biosynthesis